jgi:hypothetical protein
MSDASEREQAQIAAHIDRIAAAGREAWAQATPEQRATVRRLFRYGPPPGPCAAPAVPRAGE